MRILEGGPDLRSIVTRTSLLPPLGDRSNPRWGEAWQHLFVVYGPALRRYAGALLRTLRGRPPGTEEAEDVVQSYFADCLQKGWLSRDDVSIRCFRGYLTTQVERYVRDWVDKGFAQKRDPYRTQGAVEDLAHPPESREPPPADVLDAAWVEVVFQRALDTLRRGNPHYAEVIADLQLNGGEESADLGQRLDRSPSQMVFLRHRARKRFTILFNEELRATVRDDEAFKDLWKKLEPYLP